MKLIAYSINGEEGLFRGVVLEDGTVAQIPGDFKALDATSLDAIKRPGPSNLKLSDVTLHSPIPNPGKILCIGMNYYDHCIETGAKIPEHPVVFAKFNNTLVGHEGTIKLDGTSDEVDYEVELAFVIGSRAYQVSEADAMNYVAGYMVANDVSARDLQFADTQWVRGKTLDTFCPVGPWLVTRDEVSDPHNLGIRCRVNGQTLQDSNTSQLIFKIPFLVSYLSQGITLEPGDIVLTGTPPGVGFVRNPKIFLKPGDVVEVEIDNLGTLKNSVMDARRI